jgi:mannosyltransferase OCH1-like enzyme
VQQVRKSWELHNPTWNIILLDQSNLSQYIDHAIIKINARLPAKTDLIRLNLLAEYGGVWADATMLCMVSLNRWIYDALQMLEIRRFRRSRFPCLRGNV